jgi:hypothetical protein
MRLRSTPDADGSSLVSNVNPKRNLSASAPAAGAHDLPRRELGVVDQNSASCNQLIRWMRALDDLRNVA